MSDDNDGGDIGKLLKGSDHQSDYPRDLYTATRAEYTTNVHMNQPKGDGCKKQMMTGILLVLLIIIFMMVF